MRSPTAEQVEAAFERTGALQRGHFILSSGLHSDVYVEKFRIMEDPEAFATMCSALANCARAHRFEYVAGPVTLGVLVAHRVAEELRVKCLCAERSDNGFKFRRQSFPEGAKVLVVDDVGTTGRSLDLVQAAVESHGGLVVARGVLVARSECPKDIMRVMEVEARSWPADDLPQHLTEMPPVKLGTS